MSDVMSANRPAVARLATDVRRIVARGLVSADTAQAVADLLSRRALGARDLLTEEERQGDPDGYASYVLYSHPDFSIAGVVWRPGQVTVIHDHVAWCAFGVLSGIEHETLYRLDGDRLVETREVDNLPGDSNGFAPPGDIHMVRNTSREVGVSVHVYGADLARLGSSVRRTYDLPVTTA
ncbi:cysteine dioxygenase family protein [Spongiactinospora sp. TRM90649]|uniref:cysteine dioxygenase family protein n=1 Tax=Spongiactinospora sp. TRM90649 TaxID=3031114 RepID=UPI0023F6E00F|nr:cysteine dioxygenase family protein [Spongiactinospora sp. TRM90649]MDF5751051.1 cysteine dioxygenase family protein [Spongiactinospora sp. TRM90649]